MHLANNQDLGVTLETHGTPFRDTIEDRIRLTGIVDLFYKYNMMFITQ